MAVTLDDIAKKAGVAKSTVSVTLRNHPRAQQISAATRERVMDAAKELNYRPNFFASQLRRSDRRLVMFCIGYLQDAFTAAIGEAFDRRLSSRDYRMLISILHGETSIGASERELLGAQGITGIVVVGDSSNQISDQAVMELADEGIHVVLIGRDISHPAVSRILVDSSSGVAQAAEHIYGQGVEDLWILGSYEKKELAPAIFCRAGSMREWAKENNMPEPRIIHSGWTAEDGYRDLCKLLSQGKRPQAVFCVVDKLAYGAIRALTEAGLRVGKDVAVVGYDDIWPSATMSPTLTTVRQPMDELGVLAADMLIDVMEGQVREGRVVTLPTELMIRQSGIYCPD